MLKATLDPEAAVVVEMAHILSAMPVPPEGGISLGARIREPEAVITGLHMRSRDHHLAQDPESCEVLHAAAIEPWFTVIGTHRGHRREAVAVVAGQRVVETGKVILGVSWVISGRRYDDGPPPWGIMGVKETSP